MEELLTGDVRWATALPNLDVLAQMDGIIYRIDGESRRSEAIYGDPGDVHAAAQLADGTVLISGTEGLWVAQHTELTPSPLSSALEALSPKQMLAAPDGSLWLAAESGLFIWRDEALFSVGASGYSTSEATLAWGPDPAGGESDGLWVASGPDLYFLRPQGASFNAEYVATGEAVSGVSVDGHQVVWAIIDGFLHRRDAAGNWDWLQLPGDLADAAAAGGINSTWLSTLTELWNYSGDGWSSTGLFGQLHDSDGVGRALVTTDEGLMRVWSGRPLLLFGVDDGQKLEFAQNVELVSAPAAATPRSYEVEVDGAPLTLELGERTLVELDPINFADGPHELVARAHYRNGVTAEASVFFTVGEFEAPTWTDHIQPIHQTYCTPCHDPSGSAHLMYTASVWQAEIEQILNSVESGAMPLNNETSPTIDAVSLAEIQMIRAWAAGGFAE